MARLDRVISVEDARALARRTLPKSIFEFIDGGAVDELTLADNRSGFNRLRLVPRMMTDVSAPDLTMAIDGRTLPAPLAIAPMGSCMLAYPQADLAIARAAAARGLPYTLSTMSTTAIEDMARAVDGPLWFQLYPFRDYDFNFDLMRRAAGAGFETLVVTVDLKAAGKRERDARNAMSIPLRLTVRHLMEGMSRPGWAMRFLAGGKPDFANVRGYAGAAESGLTIAARAARDLDSAMTFDGIRRLRDAWKGPLHVKGVLDAAEAKALVEAGADGIWVSNHGGRQLDSAVASIDALPAIRAAVGPDVPLVIDSGVRRGMDIIKARAAGATISAVGRAAIYGVTAGEAGVGRVLDILLDEIRNGMMLAGTPDYRGIGADLLAPAAR
ncbi:alpha-hydroxy acid oxidase [Acuticoccus sediminis]|uniref:alpha-hydroxy acid oxidase n=1 Tax=Acuticoccus sediminis TaxID=2184697 RepID=UPI001CFECB1D|nr:alpha-hydroxy acid oxidase [Acuticoccus sediminis]